MFKYEYIWFYFRNTFLIEYIGEVIGLREFKKRSEKYAEQNNEHFYFMSLMNDLFIDATKKGNISRYFNHSCDPNCETQKVSHYMCEEWANNQSTSTSLCMYIIPVDS